MRRGFSILLVLLFGLGPLSVALGASEDSSLPACCRRHGEHHCAMATSSGGAVDGTASNSVPSFTAPPRCPLFPGFTTGPLTPAHALAASGANLPALHEQKLPIASIAAFAPVQPAGTHANRGPPATA